MSVVVWSKENCPFCVKAKDLLSKMGFTFEERVIGDQWTKEELILVAPDAKSVPQIFIDGIHVGGYTNLLKWVEDHR